jgi:predicted metalloendopeptidase
LYDYVSGAWIERKVLKIYETAHAKLASWAKGEEGDLSPLHAELEALRTDVSDASSEGALADGIAAALVRLASSGGAALLTLHAESSMEDAESTVLMLAPGSTSLPTRGHYMQTEFRAATQVVVRDLVGKERLADDFAARVMRFETKLALIDMAPAQKRHRVLYGVVALGAVLAGRCGGAGGAQRAARERGQGAFVPGQL